MKDVKKIGLIYHDEWLLAFLKSSYLKMRIQKILAIELFFPFQKLQISMLSGEVIQCGPVFLSQYTVTCLFFLASGIRIS
jgi:hypothetical protein